MLAKSKEKMFTIVVCTYNSEKIIKKCLDALTSLEGLSENIDKIIVVDNNSTDLTSKIIHEYCEENSLFQYVFESRQGLSYAREHALDANTDWIIYVDDDNILDKNWIIELKKTVEENKRLGVVNGAVIAVPAETLNKEQQAIMNAMYRNLACTHCAEPKKDDSPNTIPMGAGMCVRREALNKIESEGWLNLTGRTGKKLSSGEDTELCERIFKQGYGYESNFRMKLYHVIPTSRLEEKYVIRLIDGLVEGRVNFIKNQKFGYIQCQLRKAKYFFERKYLEKKMKNNMEKLDEYWKYKVAYLQAVSYLRYI